ncbi:hypothetical protein TrVFT333_007591 [Trichoderma virens FT-333]|nr:hypothetical protein TrVFT333_007591 [Trichoderma virens FT-333]
MVSPTTFSPMSAHHGEQGDNIVSADPGGQRATPNGLGQSNVSSSQSFVTAPRRGRGLRTEANNSNDSNQTKGDQNEHQRNYKKRAECLEIFQDIQDALWQQFHQMQTIVFDSKEIECTLQELSIEEFDIELIRALRTLGNSLTGVRHILKGNIVMMEEAKAAPSPSSSVASSSTPQSDEHGMTSSRVGSPDTVETEPDLLLDDVTFDLEITGTSDVDGDQPIDNWNIALTEGDDPFVDTSGEDATIPLDLNYKPDAADIHMPASHTGIRSRRVILKNLPPDATLPLITRGIRCHGGLVSMMMINTAPIFGDNTKTAILEFMHHQSAVQFTNATNKSPLLYKAKNGDVYSADPWLVPSSSYGFGRIDRGLIDNKCTRVLLLKGFPKECIWYFINAVGMNNIAYADYDQSLDGFTVAFTSLFQANKADWLIFQGRFSDFYTINPQDAKFRIFLQDSTHVVERSRVNARQLETPIIHRSGDDFEEQWNRYPYNDYLPPHLRKAAAQSGPTRLSLKTRLALQYDIDESEVDDYLDDLEKYKDTEYRLIGSSITLKRRKWGWSISAEDENKLFLANTLHEPEWAEHWDEHFKSCGEINRRRWEHYGMVAKHRREKAAEQGLSLDSVPKCPKGCEMGCRDIKTVPAAPVVKKFFEKRY